MTFCNILTVISGIFLTLSIILFVSAGFIGIIAGWKTDIKNIDAVLYKFKNNKIDKLLLLLAITCFYIALILFIILIAVEVSIGG